MEKIKSGNENKTILVSTHSMEEVDKFCDRVIVLNRGGIIANDSPANIKISWEYRSLQKHTLC